MKVWHLREFSAQPGQTKFEAETPAEQPAEPPAEPPEPAVNFAPAEQPEQPAEPPEPAGSFVPPTLPLVETRASKGRGLSGGPCGPLLSLFELISNRLADV